MVIFAYKKIISECIREAMRPPVWHAWFNVKHKCTRRLVQNSGSQTFWARGTLIWYKKFGGTPKSKIRPKKYCFYMLFRGFFKDLAAHLKKFHSTLVCRGTPVEKHWCRRCYSVSNMTSNLTRIPHLKLYLTFVLCTLMRSA